MTDNRVTLKVYNPAGAIETAQAHAPRLDTLAGKTICELSNAEWEYERIFPAIRESLQKQFPTAKFIPYTETIWQRSVLENLTHVGKVLKEKGCQAVIVGMAG